jgi:hypothetical protein
MSPAVCDRLREQNNRNGIVRFGSMTEQEQAEFCERNRLAVQQTRSQQAAQRQLPNQNQVENESFDGFKTAVGGLLDFLKNSDDPDKLFGDIQKNPEKAVLPHCLSSGSLRFDQCKDHGNEWDDKTIDLDRVEEEIKDEQLSPAETGQLIKEWFERHSHADERLMSCGSCGVRMLERQHAPEIRFSKVLLNSPLLNCLRCTDEETDNFCECQERDTALSVPCSENFEQMNVHAWKAHSACESPMLGLFHLHPELVRCGNESNTESTHLCGTCFKKIKKSEVPRLSIKAGINFGCHRRLGMELPNLHEQIILSRCRLFFASVKTTSNTHGHVNFSRHKIKLHAILFAHGAPGIASKLLTAEEMLNEKHLKQTLRTHLVDEKGKFSSLAREAFGSNQLLARPWVLWNQLPIISASVFYVMCVICAGEGPQNAI